MKITYMKQMHHKDLSARIVRLPAHLKMAIVISLVLVFFAPMLVSTVSQDPIDMNRLLYVCRSALLVGITLVYFVVRDSRTEVVSDNEGLHITFFWQQIDIRWKDIQAIKPRFRLGTTRNNAIVLSNSLTVFHRVIGLLFTFSLTPGIHIDSWLKDYEALVNRIRCHIRQNESKESEEA